ncbi:MAG: hypothetical protein RI973_1769 [Bacteroidota bacterium]|jgi:alpha-L-fucosidase
MKANIVLLTFLCLSTAELTAQKAYQPSADNLKARKEFQEDRFGLFIHWGVYSMLGDGEWVMQNQDIPVSQYELLPSFFNPIAFNAAEWVAMAKAAGMKYITITTKHHDGFAMYDSKVSDYNIVKKTPFGRDIFRELEQACKKEGLKLYAYYSQLDWHHPDYYPRGWTGRRTGRPESGKWEDYLDYQDAQIRELAENYDISGFWFDGWWDQYADESSQQKAARFRLPKNQIDWQLERTYSMIHKVKPALLIGNNHHKAPFAGEDFQMFEKDLPGHNTTGFGSSADEVGNLPLETCETINRSWGFNLQDRSNKSGRELIQYLVKAAGYGSNFLLNVGPMPNGQIQPDHRQLLAETGQWMQRHGETIYGTKAGAIPPQDWGVSTQKGKKLYLHVLDFSGEVLFIPNAGQLKFSNMSFYPSGQKVAVEVVKNGWLIELPQTHRNNVDTIIEVELK